MSAWDAKMNVPYPPTDGHQSFQLGTHTSAANNVGGQVHPPGSAPLELDVVEVGFCLRVRSAMERRQSMPALVYDVEVLVEYKVIDFALDSVNDPLGYLLIRDGAQPPIIVPFYVPKTFSGNITAAVLNSEIKDVKFIGLLYPLGTPSTISSVEPITEESLFGAPLFVMGDIPFQEDLALRQSGGVRSWVIKEHSLVIVKDIVVWNPDIHPPHDYTRKRTRSNDLDPSGSSGEFEAQYQEAFLAGPQGAQFGVDGERPSGLTSHLTPNFDWTSHSTPIPPSKKQRKLSHKPAVPVDQVTRQGLVLLRRDLQFYDPEAIPTHADVPDIFGGGFAVEEYTDHIYPEAVTILGLSPDDISKERKGLIISQLCKLIPAYYGECKQKTRWQVEGSDGPNGRGGYGISRNLPTAVRRAMAIALLENDNYLFANGVLHTELDLKYSHFSLRQLTWRLWEADVHPQAHPFGKSGENVGKQLKIASLSSNAFPSLGAATSASLIFDELTSIANEGTGVAAIRGLQRLPIHEDMISEANARVRTEVWALLWNVEPPPPVCGRPPPGGSGERNTTAPNRRRG